MTDLCVGSRNGKADKKQRCELPPVMKKEKSAKSWDPVKVAVSRSACPGTLMLFNAASVQSR